MRQTRRQNFRKLSETKMFRAVLRRYHRLVDKSCLDDLTRKEYFRLQRLGRRIDRFEEPFYAPIIARMEQESR